MYVYIFLQPMLLDWQILKEIDLLKSYCGIDPIPDGVNCNMKVDFIKHIKYIHSENY